MKITRRVAVLAGGSYLAGAAGLADAGVADAKESTGSSKTMTLPAEYQKLVDAAIEFRKKAYAPYSNFLVGAALLAEDGTVFPGVNVENGSYGATNCAERTAVFSAVASGHRKFKAMAVVGDLDTPLTPCGICRQVLCEFGKDMVVICANLKGDSFVTTAGALLPAAFDFEQGKK